MKGPGSEKLVDISLESKDENGNEKKFYTIKEIVEAIAKSYHIDLTGTADDGRGGDNNYENNLYRKIFRELSDGINSGDIVKDGKEYKIPVDYVWRLLRNKKFIKYIYTFGCSGRDRTNRKKKLEYLDAKAEKVNEAHWSYMESGQYIEDMRELQAESDSTGEQEAINKKISDTKIDIITQYAVNKFKIDNPEFQKSARKGEEEAIDDEIRKKKFEIVIEYILENLIEIDEALLIHDVVHKYIELPGETDDITLEATERLENLKNYYRERDKRK